jgi:hypothetical protein
MPGLTEKNVVTPRDPWDGFFSAIRRIMKIYKLICKELFLVNVEITTLANSQNLPIMRSMMRQFFRIFLSQIPVNKIMCYIKHRR